MIPNTIKIKNDQLPENPGVYFYFDRTDKLLYIGKATSLRARVGSYFNKAHNDRLAELVSKIARIDYIETPTVIEALVLEANQIHANKPPYNVMLKDDKSFLYLVITHEDFPKPLLMRALELERLGINPFSKTLSAKAKEKYLAVYGPYTSSTSLKKALELIRRSIPWSTCESPAVKGNVRPCFDRHLKKCPGVCTGEISKADYRKIIRQLMLFFEGKKAQVIKEKIREVSSLSKAHKFEEASVVHKQVAALEHIQDVALITKDDLALPLIKTSDHFIDLSGRLEAYDISNISGTSSVGSMVVFEDGKPAKHLYRKFKIKTVFGPNDFASMEEMLTRRLKRAQLQPNAWPLPELMIIDGGEGQVNRVKKVIDELFPVIASEAKQSRIPVVGIAKGFDRKQDRLVYDKSDAELTRVVSAGKELLQRVRDEAHRFAVSYHRQLRSKASGVKGLRK